jgi:hypothetical protein
MSFHQLVRAALSPKIITAMTSIAPSIFIQDTKKFSHLDSNLFIFSMISGLNSGVAHMIATGDLHGR